MVIVVLLYFYSRVKTTTFRYPSEYYDIDAVRADAYDILAEEMMGIEGFLDEHVWEPRVMSDPNIVFADLVSPEEEEFWAELEKQKDEEWKDIDGYERFLLMEAEEVEEMLAEISKEPYFSPGDEEFAEVRLREQAWAESYMKFRRAEYDRRRK